MSRYVAAPLSSRLGPSVSNVSTSPASSSATPAYDEAAVRAGLADAFAGTNPTRRERTAGDCFADELMASATPEQLEEGGLVADDGAAVPLFGVPVPDAIDYVASFGAAGVVGVTLDHPRIGHHVPLANLGLLSAWAAADAD